MGFVEFNRIEDAQKVLAAPAKSLVLNNRVMVVRVFKETQDIGNIKTTVNKPPFKMNINATTFTPQLKTVEPAQPKDTRCFVHILPTDVLINIFSRLSPKDLLNVGKGREFCFKSTRMNIFIQNICLTQVYHFVISSLG